MSYENIYFWKSSGLPCRFIETQIDTKLWKLMAKKWWNFPYFQRSVEPWCGKWVWTKFKEARTITGHGLQVSCCCDQCLWEGTFQWRVSFQNLSTRSVSCRISFQTCGREAPPSTCLSRCRNSATYHEGCSLTPLFRDAIPRVSLVERVSARRLFQTLFIVGDLFQKQHLNTKKVLVGNRLQIWRSIDRQHFPNIAVTGHFATRNFCQQSIHH